MSAVAYDQLNSRGRARLDEMIRVLSLSKKKRPLCEACVRRDGFGRWREEHPGKPMPRRRATCAVWIRDRRVMIDLSHLELSCDYHADFYPYPQTVDYGNGPRPNESGQIRVQRQIVWPPQETDQ